MTWMQHSLSLSRTHSSVALSSGEAELYAAGLGTAETLYVRSLLLEASLAAKCTINAHTDNSTCKLLASRFGTGKKTKHVQLRFLYLQELAATGLLKMRKVNTVHNFAAVLTKHVTGDVLRRHLTSLGAVSGTHYSMN